MSWRSTRSSTFPTAPPNSPSGSWRARWASGYSRRVLFALRETEVAPTDGHQERRHDEQRDRRGECESANDGQRQRLLHLAPGAEAERARHEPEQRAESCHEAVSYT